MTTLEALMRQVEALAVHMNAEGDLDTVEREAEAEALGSAIEAWAGDDEGRLGEVEGRLDEIEARCRTRSGAGPETDGGRTEES